MQISTFSAMSKGERGQFLTRYRSFLLDRNGTPDFVRGQLSRREKFLGELVANPIHRTGPAVVEQRVYEENAIARAVAKEGLDEWSLWAICLSKCSRMEEYAVRYLDEVGRTPPTSTDDPYSIIDLEEPTDRSVTSSATAEDTLQQTVAVAELSCVGWVLTV